MVVCSRKIDLADKKRVEKKNRERKLGTVRHCKLKYRKFVRNNKDKGTFADTRNQSIADVLTVR